MGGAFAKPVDSSDLLAHKVNEIMSVEKKDIVSLSPEDTFETALQLFHDNNILSAPIINDDDECLGFFAMDDVIIRLNIVAKKSISLEGKVESPHIRSDEAQELEHRAQLFLQHKVKEAIDEHRSSGNLYLGINGDETIKDALLAFATGVQRIAVFDSSKNITSILSQSTLLRFISEDTTRLGPIADQPAEKLGIPWSRLVKLTDKALVIDAVETMHKHSVYSLPIVLEVATHQGDHHASELRLVAHLSMSDFKKLYLTRGSLDQLLIHALKFVQDIREAAGKPKDHIVSVPHTATVKDVVLAMVNNHVHQLYLVDPAKPDVPLSLVSMTNVCHKLFSHHHTEAINKANQ